MQKKSAAERLIHSAHVRLDEAEDRAFQQVINQLHTSRSKLLKKIIRELIGEGPDLLAHEMKAFEEAVYQVGAVGRNLNQWLRAIHMRQVSVSPDQQALVESLRDRVESVRLELHKAMDRSRHRWVRHES